MTKPVPTDPSAALAALARNQAGSRLDLPCGLAAEKTYETLRIFRKNTNEKTDILKNITDLQNKYKDEYQLIFNKLHLSFLSKSYWGS